MTIIYDTAESSACLWSDEFRSGHVGSDPYITTLPMTEPGPVLKLTVTQMTYTAVSIDFKAPVDDGGDDIQG